MGTSNDVSNNNLYVGQEDPRSRVGDTARSRIGRNKRDDGRSRVGIPDQGVNPAVDAAVGDENRGRADVPVEDRGRSKGNLVADVEVCTR